MRGEVTALVGAQYGSEGKGLVAAALAPRFGVHVRTGGPNAGHTFWHEERKWVGRSVPCGWVNPEALLLIGPGAVIDLQVLLREVVDIEHFGYNIRDRLLVDERAVLISRSQHMGEGGVGGHAHEAIGSTGEGVGLARMARINRDVLIPPDRAPFNCVRVGDRLREMREHGLRVGDASRELRAQIRLGSNVLLEGTQGSGLSLTLGPWPFCTSTDTNCAQLAADAGISGSEIMQTYLVARTFPIRVAGSSGPLRDEITWEEVGQEPEHTTVTGKVRRVGRWNMAQVIEAAELNHPASLVITFLDYLFPETAGVTDWADLSDDAQEWLSGVEDQAETWIIGVGTGPQTLVMSR